MLSSAGSSSRLLQELTLVVTLLAGAAQSQNAVSNPKTQIATCDTLQCSDNVLCSTGGSPYGIGIAPQILLVPGSSSNLTLSLIDNPGDLTIFAFPGYDFLTHGQRLLVGAPSGLDLRSQPPACALMFQNQGQTFPYLTDSASPNSTACGDTLDAAALQNLGSYIRDFNFDSRAQAVRNITGVPVCSQMASYVDYRIRDRGAFLGAFYSSVLTITGGAILGPDANTTQYVPSSSTDNCRPVLPGSYQLHNVLSTQQVLHPSAASDPSFGGRNGTTPVLTAVYDSTGSVDVRMFCMRQFAPGNQTLPHEAAKTSSIDRVRIPRLGVASFAMLAGLYTLVF